MKSTKSPNYVATKSAWSAVSFWAIAFSWLIFPLIIMIVRIISIKSERIEFYDTSVVVKKGILNQKERNSTLTSIISVSVNKSLWGRIFGYGDVEIDIVGRWDINTKGIKNPEGLKNYLLPLISAQGITQHISN